MSAKAVLSVFVPWTFVSCTMLMLIKSTVEVRVRLCSPSRVGPDCNDNKVPSTMDIWSRSWMEDIRDVVVLLGFLPRLAFEWVNFPPLSLAPSCWSMGKRGWSPVICPKSQLIWARVFDSTRSHFDDLPENSQFAKRRILDLAPNRMLTASCWIGWPD